MVTYKTHEKDEYPFACLLIDLHQFLNRRDANHPARADQINEVIAKISGLLHQKKLNSIISPEQAAQKITKAIQAAYAQFTGAQKDLCGLFFNYDITPAQHPDWKSGTPSKGI